MREDHRVLEEVGRYLARWRAKVGLRTETRGVVRAVVDLGLEGRLLALEVVDGFRGIPGPVAVVAEIGDKPGEVVFAWSGRRG